VIDSNHRHAGRSKENSASRRSVLLASGRVATLDDGLDFRLVAWRPVIEQRLGQTVGALVREAYAS